MTKSNITEYDNTAANNTDVEDVPLGENLMYPSHVNNAFREMMADLADVNDGTVSLTSPSFSSVNIDAGTIDGTVIGGTTPAAGTFTTGQFNTSLNVDGTVTADGLSVNGTGDLGTIGNGAFNAAAALGFQGDRAFFGYSSSQNALIQSGASKGVAIEVNNDTLDSGTRAALFASNGDISFYDDSDNAKFFWDASAESLGIGTSSLVSKLDVAGNIGFGSGGTFGAGQLYSDANWGVILRAKQSSPAQAEFAFQNADGTERMRIDSSGRVGIGTAPTDLVHLKEANGTATSTQLLLHNNNTGSGSAGVAFQVTSDGETASYAPKGAILFERTASNGRGVFKFMSDNVGDTNPFSAADEVMRIDSSGRVGIGVTDPSEKLEVAGKVKLDANNAGIQLKSGVAGTEGLIKWTFNTESTNYATAGITFNNRATDGFLLDVGYPITLDATTNIKFKISGSEEMRLEADGDLHVDGNVVAYSTTISDIRLKKDIAPIEDAVTKVQQLNGCTFTYLRDDRKSAGLIAQDVEKVLPSAVIEDEAVFHGEEGETYKTVQYDQVIGLLVEAVKELKAEIEELKNGTAR